MAITRKPECVWALDAELGEGPLWSPRESALWFVDIKRRKIHRYDHETGRGSSFDAPEEVGFVAELPDGKFVAGLKSGLHTFDPRDGSFVLRHVVEPDRPGNRLNDGAVGADGHLWFGSMDNREKEPTGALYRLDQNGPRRMDDGYVITNGPAFSPDGRTFYHTDTRQKTIYAFRAEPDGALRDKTPLIRIAEGQGSPDGTVVDSEGRLWVGMYHGWSARIYSAAGEHIGTIDFPCANVTKVAFGGPDLRTGYATTAGRGRSEAERTEQPLAGGLFRFEVDVPGLPPGEVRFG